MGRVPGIFTGGAGQNVYFLMRPMGSPGKPDPAETASVRWVTPQEARELISATINALGRKRDLDVLEATITAAGKLEPLRSFDPDLPRSDPS